MSFWKGLFGGKSTTQSSTKTTGSSSDARRSIFGSIASGNERDLKACLDGGDDPDTTDKGGGVTALAFAAMKGEAACAKLLIEFGAEVDVADSSGWTPLMHAVMQGKKLACVQVLLDAGADVTKTLKGGISVKTLAQNSTPEIEAAIRTKVDQVTAAVLSATAQLTGEITLIVSFELARLRIQISGDGPHGRAINISGTRFDGLIGKQVIVDYSNASTTVSKDGLDVLTNCCVDMEREFSALIKSGNWQFEDGAFQAQQLIPRIVKALEPWAQSHITYRGVSISFNWGA
ncbi:MAG TPA: ankyrin repeat domain-containing protein [Reyranella sp.]|nr:ankyrin repeat domain-containing protein [Reyranella sp.]